MRGNKKQMGGARDSTGLIMLQSTVMMSIWACMEVTCDVRGRVVFENVKVNQFKKAPHG